MSKIYINKKILELLYSVRKFVGKDDRSVYYMIKQEIKYNPIYKNVRFMSEQKFYEVLAIGKYYAHQENCDKKYNNIIDLYYCVSRIQNIFMYECYQKWYETVLNDEHMTRHRYSYLLKLLVKQQKRAYE